MQRLQAALQWRLRSATARVAGARRRLPSGSVALTFDDGPDPESTPAVLDILAAHGAPATFFLVGKRVRRHPELVRRIVAEGHAVGSHSDTHRLAGLSTDAAMADFEAGHRSLEDVLGRQVTLFRPPHGHLPGTSAWRLRNDRRQTWLWTVDPKDYAPGTTVASARWVLGRCTPGDVVLMHDGLEEAMEGAPPRTLLHEVLPQALTELAGRGVTFEVLDPQP